MGPLELLARVVPVLERLDMPYFVSGSIASMHYGEYRSTMDVDIVALVRLGSINDLVKAFPEPDYYVSREGIMHAMEHGGMFNIIHVPSGLKADIIVTDGVGYDRDRLQRAQRREYLPGQSAMFSSPEDVIVHKLKFYREGGSDKHLRDIASMLKVSGAALDRAYIEQWAASFGVTDVWCAILARLRPSPG